MDTKKIKEIEMGGRGSKLKFKGGVNHTKDTYE